MEKKYQVFVSSTYNDLKDERLATINILLDNNCIPVGMEQFPASGLGVMEYIEKVLVDCDYYVLILAGRYGSLDADGISFTEKEFLYAKAHSIPILVFYHSDIDSLPISKCEKTDLGRQRLDAFRKKAMQGTVAKAYSSVDDLKAQIATAINKAKIDSPRAGWVRASWPAIVNPEAHALTLPNMYQFELSGTFVSVQMPCAEQPLFFPDGFHFNVSIVAGNDYELKVSTCEGRSLSIGLIPDMAFFPGQLIPSQYPMHYSKLNIHSNGGIIWESKNKCFLLQIVQTGSHILEYVGRYAVYTKSSFPGDITSPLAKLSEEVKQLQEKVSKSPSIRVGTKLPEDLKTGEFFCR